MSATADLIADGVFYFLPILIAITAAQKLKANPILALGTVVMLLHPNWANLVASGKPVSLFHTIPFTLTNYASSVIPIILIICVQAYIEKYLNQSIEEQQELLNAHFDFKINILYSRQNQVTN